MYRICVKVGDVVDEAPGQHEKRQAAVYRMRQLRKANPWAEYWIESTKEWPEPLIGRQVTQ